MQTGLTVSITLHAAVIAALWVGVPSFGEPMAPSESVPVEVVSTDEFKARTQPQKPEPAPAPATSQSAAAGPAEPAPPEREPANAGAPPEPEPAPQPEQAASAASPPAPQSAPEPERAKAGPPDVPKPSTKPDLQLARAAQAEPEPEPKSEPEPAETSQPATQQPADTAGSAPPKPRTKPRVRLKDSPEQKDAAEADQLTSILKDVESELSEAAQRRENDAEKAPSKTDTPAPTQQAKTEPTPKAREQLSASQIADVRRQLQDCWRVPAGAKNAANLVVEIAVRLNRDGSVRHAEIATTDRMNDSFYRAAAESALRAVHICSPLEGLPVDKYGTWQRMRLTFDPEEMFGS